MVQPERRNQQTERVLPLTLPHQALGHMLDQIYPQSFHRPHPMVQRLHRDLEHLMERVNHLPERVNQMLQDQALLDDRHTERDLWHLQARLQALAHHVEHTMHTARRLVIRTQKDPPTATGSGPAILRMQQPGRHPVSDK